MAKQQQLSPEKYIQTRARTLQIGTCYVNPAWEEAKLATVAVQRLHTNGNITVGIYMVDLMCRGVKDSFHFFNKSQYEVDEHFDFTNTGMWQKIDYALAHNIVYAGHDFAMDYHIEPHKLFSVTKYILEEDNDKVSLIEIETGDEEGKPYLLVGPSENYGSVLAKLKQYAGEGNYTFTIADDEDMDWEEEDDDIDEPTLDEIEEGFLDFNHVSEISTMELIRIISDNERTTTEAFIIKSELLMRLYQEENPDTVTEEYGDVIASSDYRIYEKGKDRWLEANERNQFVYGELLNDMKAALQEDIMAAASINEYLSLVEKYCSNELGLLALFQTTPILLIIKLYDVLLERFNKYPPAGQLFIAAVGLLTQHEVSEAYEFILRVANVEAAYPADMRIHGLHHKFFWFVKAAQALKEEDEKSLWHWHNLINVTGIGGNFKFLYAAKLKNWLEEKLGMEKDDEIDSDDFISYES